MRKFLSSFLLTLLCFVATGANAQTVGETLLGTPQVEYMTKFTDCTFVKFVYSGSNDDAHTKIRVGGDVKLYQGETLVETVAFGNYMSPYWAAGAMFTTILDPTKDYRVEFPEGIWAMNNDKTGNDDEISPAKTLTIEATAAPSLAGEKILGTAKIEYKEAYAGQCTLINFAYPDADESVYYRKSANGTPVKLYLGEELIEEASFGFIMSPTFVYGAKFNTILDRTKTYKVVFGEGCWYMSSDEDGENKVEVSPEKTFTIEATSGGGGGGGSEVTPWNFTSVTPADGETVASLNKITVMAAGTNLGSVTGMTKGVIKCNETNVETNIFFMPNFAGTGLEASFTKITAEGTYTLTIAEGAVKVGDNPNNAFTATWTVGEVTPPAPTTTTLTLDATTATLNVGDTKQLTANSNIVTNIHFESSDIEVATVNETGLVRAIGAGTATIKASIAAADDHTAAEATCEVTVNAPAPATDLATITIGEDVIVLSETEAIELENYPAGAIIKVNIEDEAIKMARYEIIDVTTGEGLKSFADMTKGEGYYYCEMPRTYGMAAGHDYKIHVWFRNSQSSFSGQTIYEYNFLVKGTNKNVPVLSTVSEYESVSPTEDFVLTGVTGTNTIEVRFKGEAPASATAWAIVGQGNKQSLTTEIVGNTVKVTVPNSAIAQGVLSLFVQAKDAEGHVIGGGSDMKQSVNPDNGSLSWSWASEVGCEQPKMAEAGTTVDELKTVTFKASDILSLDEGQLVKVGEGQYIRRYNQLQVMDKLGNVIVSEVSADQYEQVGNNIVLTLKEGIIEAGEYTVVLPYGAFLIGEEQAAASNASGTYVVTVTGNLVPAPVDILGEAKFNVTADKITISFPNAQIPAGIADGEVNLPGGVIINTPDGTEDTEKYAYPDMVTLPTTDGISFTFSNPCGANAVVTIPAGGIEVTDYTTDQFNGKVIYTNAEAITYVPELPTEPFASITIGEEVIELSETEAIELENYPEGAIIKVNIEDEAIKMARYEIIDVTTGEGLKSFADMTKGEGYYYCEMPRTYGMAAGHDYKIHVWFRNSMSSFSGQTIYEYNFLVKGTNKNVPVLSTVSEYESVSPTEDFVLTGVTGTNTINVRFKGEAPASATAWSTLEQGVRMNLETEIAGNTVNVIVPNNAISHGVLVLFVQAKDAEGHIIGGGDQSVNPDNGTLSWSWASEVGCEMPKMTEDGTTVDELKTVTFTASDVLSLDESQLIKVGEGQYIRRYNQLQVMDKLGNVIVSEVSANQYSVSGNSVTLTLKEGIVEAGEYTVVLPYGAFLIGEEYAAASNASGTYVVTVTGNLAPKPEDILGEAEFTVTADKITISFPNAQIPAGIADGEVNLPGGVIINTPDGTEDTEKYAYPDKVTLPTTDGISFTFSNPCGANAVVTIPAGGIEVTDYTTDMFNGKVIYSNPEAITYSGNPTGISSATNAANGAKVIYNLAGQKVNDNAKGIVIINGKKVLR